MSTKTDHLWSISQQPPNIYLRTNDGEMVGTQTSLLCCLSPLLASLIAQTEEMDRTRCITVPLTGEDVRGVLGEMVVGMGGGGDRQGVGELLGIEYSFKGTEYDNCPFDLEQPIKASTEHQVDNEHERVSYDVEPESSQ